MVADSGRLGRGATGPEEGTAVVGAVVRWEGRDVDIGEPWEDSWQPVAQGWMSQDQIDKARAMEAAKYGVSGSKRGHGAGTSAARASGPEETADAGGWRAGKLRARDANGRAVRSGAEA